ncbi:MAG: lipopolysaccharide biosynthesis protein [Steroidobacteraceae bacterium]
MSAISNVRWVGMSQGARLALQLGGLAVLSRLLSPAVFGLVAMAAVVTNFANLLRDLGTAAAVIQRKELSEATIAAAYWFSVGSGTIIGIALAAAAPLLASLFRRPDLTGLLRVLALSFPLASLGTVHQALLERDSRFSTVAGIEMLSSSVGLGVAILAAALGAGAYSIALQTVVVAGLSSLQFWRASPWRPRRAGALLRELRSIWHFSGPLVGFNLINYLGRNADAMIIGRLLGAVALGPYSMAYRLMLFPVQNFTYVANRALFPVYSRRQDSDQGVRELYLRTLGVIASITAPLMAGTLALRYPLVQVLMGPKWGLTAAVLTWLAPVGFIQSLASCSGAIYMARGRTRLLMATGAAGSALMISSFLLGVRWGVLGVARGYLCANLLTGVPVFYITMRLLGGTLTELIGRIWRPIAGAGVMALAVAWAQSSMQDIGWPQWLRLVLGVTLGALLYGAMALRFAGNVLLDVRSLLGSRARG